MSLRYQPHSQASGRRVTNWVVSLFLCLLLAAIFYPVTGSSRPTTIKTACLSRIKQLGLAEQMYAADNDDRFSSASKWIEETQPYTKSSKDEVYTCPSLLPSKKFGYAMADGMSSARVTEIVHPESQVLFFETPTLVRDAHFPGVAPVVPWRHQGARNFAYADGHAKGIRQNL